VDNYFHDTTSLYKIPLKSLPLPTLFISSNCLLGLLESPKGTPAFSLFSHLWQNSGTIVPFPPSTTRESLIRTISSPLLQYSLLAISAAHLHHLCPNNIEHRIATYYYTDHALEHYRAYLSLPTVQLGQEDVTSLMASGVLLNVLAFTLKDENGDAGSEEDDRSGWLALQAGLRPLFHRLIEAASNKIKGSMLHNLGQLFLGERKDSWNVPPFSHAGPPTEPVPSSGAIPASWKKVFGLDSLNLATEDCAAVCNSPHAVFVPLLKTLSRLRNKDPAQSSVLMHFAVLSKMHPQFRCLLRDNEPRALWAFGYWVGLMRRFVDADSGGALWWCEDRVRKDCAEMKWRLNRLGPMEIAGEVKDDWNLLMEEFRELIMTEE
jgi:hypothetical protein